MLAEEKRGPPASDLAAVPVLCSFALCLFTAFSSLSSSSNTSETPMMLTVRRGKRKIIGTEKTKNTMATEYNGPLLQFGYLSNKVND